MKENTMHQTFKLSFIDGIDARGRAKKSVLAAYELFLFSAAVLAILLNSN